MYQLKKGSAGSAEAPHEHRYAATLGQFDEFGDSGQLIVIENKESPDDVADAVHYEWFAGEEGPDGEATGFIP